MKAEENKMILFFKRVISVILTFGMMLYGVVIGANNFDTVHKYEKNVESVEIYENTMDTAVPQTEIYNILKNHFTSALPEGKTVKKAVVLGYDGCRADTLKILGDASESAIMTLINDGGKAVISYCGGVNYPNFNTQATSTAPGWCSMLTGQWADVHGIKKNYVPKSNDHLTLLTTLVEDGTIDSSAFYVSRDGHFNESDCTYWNEKSYAAEKGLNVNFVDAGDDNGTYSNVITDLGKADCSDFIFSIFEYCDHEGHTTGFDPKNKRYANKFNDVQKAADEIISAVKARPTYETEDWLILITADHGGFDLTHGSMTIQERYTFIIANKDFNYTPEAQADAEPLC